MKEQLENKHKQEKLVFITINFTEKKVKQIELQMHSVHLKNLVKIY